MDHSVEKMVEPLSAPSEYGKINDWLPAMTCEITGALGTLAAVLDGCTVTVVDEPESPLLFRATTVMP
jgi:hypothetical protein